jgi:acyl-CoA thioesterase-1
MKSSHPWTLALLVATVSHSAADLVAYQGFDGYAAGPLPGQTVGANTVGLNPAGTITSAGTGANANVFEATGLTFSNLVTSGGSGLYSDATGRPSYIGFAYDGATVTGTLYSSYLVRLVTAQNTVSVASLRVNATATTGGAGSYFHTYADSVGSTFTGSQYEANNLNTASTTTLATGTDYVVIGRFTRVGMPLAAGTPGQATTFVLSAAQFDFFKDGGFTDAELDGALIGTGPANVTSRVSDAPVNTGTFTLTSGNGVQFGPGNGATSQTVAYDELRFGTTLDDVLPVTVDPDPDPVDVTLNLSGPDAHEPTAASDLAGSFTLSRAGDTTAALRIYLSMSGSATNGVDYPEVPASVLIPAGASSVVIPVPAYTDSVVEGTETATLTITPDAGYILPPTPTATVTLSDRPAGVLASKSRFVQKLAAGLQQRVVVYGTSLTASGSWPGQLKATLDATWPGQTTLINRGSGGMASDWGITNLQAQVITATPDVVFIEFAVNDAVARLDISLPEARANLEGMIDGIQAAYPQCEIILQVMNPVIGRPQGDPGWRPNLEHYQQIYRDVAAERDITVIDHHPAWQALLDVDEAEFYFHVPDGLHPSSQGEASFLVPALLATIGAPHVPEPSIIVDDLGATATGDWIFSSATPGAYLTNYLTDNNVDKGLKSMTYVPEIPTAGTYPVYLRWTAHANRATNVPVTIHHVGGSTVVTVNQTLNGGIWFKLGDFPLAAGDSNSVVIETTGTNGYVIADAVGVSLPSVTLHASNGRAGEPATVASLGRTSVLRVSRTGPLTQALSVDLSYGGDAVNGSDYELLPASITIPVGASSASLVITPKFDALREGPETLTVESLPPAGMTAGLPAKASLVVVDPDDSPFADWQRDQFSEVQLADPAVSGEDGDPDRDGIVNLIEYFAGYQPLAAESSFMSLGTVEVEGVDYFSITYPRAPGTGLAGIPELSTDLQVWQSGNAWLESSADAEADVQQQVTVRSRAAMGSMPREFLRLEVTR